MPIPKQWHVASVWNISLRCPGGMRTPAPLFEDKVPSSDELQQLLG
ncbi:hypothetical protein PSTAB_1984 [Stutzerimonas stutzeri]|uniref:Uncharacterized protein n=1 Tax=Stutzerimonas stutzeri (strain ATCC 17588 / DSM 5190 / CCUG 11256 / JCM 5965 / LMG 11199 / NBRC 14165 / NCIMB 11358 / Stanier 221) TaxID=96563 RepID=F8HA55_STUS2|nr:hypothetical protein PSTAB_1984 [Stutzerimonas stutzeri]